MSIHTHLTSAAIGERRCCRRSEFAGYSGGTRQYAGADTSALMRLRSVCNRHRKRKDATVEPALCDEKSRCFYAVAARSADFGVNVETSHDLPRVRLGAVTCEGARRWSGLCARFPRDLITVPLHYRNFGASNSLVFKYLRICLESPSLCCVSWKWSRALQGALLCRWLCIVAIPDRYSIWCPGIPLLSAPQDVSLLQWQSCLGRLMSTFAILPHVWLCRSPRLDHS
jgi:hypothetical protein